MRIHLVSEHASPLALLGGVDAGGQNVHVAALAQAARRTRRRRRRAHPPRRSVAAPPGARSPRASSSTTSTPGRPCRSPKDELLPYMGEFADDLDRQWQRERPDVVHAHFWMSGIAAVDAARGGRRAGRAARSTPSVPRSAATKASPTRSPTARLDVEQWLARTVDHVIATTAAGVPRRWSAWAPTRRV